MFARSLEYKTRFKNLTADGDSKTHAIFLEEKTYGPEKYDQVEKLDCIGHVQKRMGSCLSSLKTEWKGRKLSDGNTIGRVGRLTKGVMDSLQNYYGDAIRKSVGDLQGMMKAVQATTTLQMNVPATTCVRNHGANTRKRKLKGKSITMRRSLL